MPEQRRVNLAPTTVKATWDVTPVGFAERHPELHHYTTIQGLKGILQSNSLWATHFEDLNDASEVVLLRDPLSEAIFRRTLKRFIERQKHSLRVRTELSKRGGAMRISRQVADDLVSSLYRVTFQDDTSEPMGIPFIASFCTHSGPQTYERDHGLLSHWRGYGGIGGCCVVFDTKLIVARIMSEFEKSYYVHASVADVTYAFDGFSIEDLLPSLLDRCEDIVKPFVEGLDAVPPENDLFSLLVAGATRLKHQGFKEEQEVRIVAIPASERVISRIRAEHPDAKTFPAKQIRHRDVGERARRYITLFENVSGKLPIKRLIIGPSTDQQALAERVREVAGGLPIICSSTPCIP